jgi:hypothetical protein
MLVRSTAQFHSFFATAIVGRAQAPPIAPAEYLRWKNERHQASACTVERNSTLEFLHFLACLGRADVHVRAGLGMRATKNEVALGHQPESDSAHLFA